jgi:hypothetical protein
MQHEHGSFIVSKRGIGSQRDTAWGQVQPSIGGQRSCVLSVSRNSRPTLWRHSMGPPQDSGDLWAGMWASGAAVDTAHLDALEALAARHWLGRTHGLMPLGGEEGCSTHGTWQRTCRVCWRCQPGCRALAACAHAAAWRPCAMSWHRHPTACRGL